MIDCLPIQCWDLNQDRLCTIPGEDRNFDGACNVTDCAAAYFIFTPLLSQYTIVMRDGNGSFAAYDITVQRLIVNQSIEGLSSSSLSVQTLNTQLLYSSSGNLTLQSSDIINYDVVVDDDLIVNGILVANSIAATPSTNDLLLNANNVIINGTLLVETMSAYVNNITIDSNLDINGRLGATVISNYGNNNLTLSPGSRVVYSNGNLVMDSNRTLFTNEIRGNTEVDEVVFSSPVSAGNISVDQIFAASEFLTLFVGGVNINGTLAVGSIQPLIGTNVPFPNGISTRSVFGSSSLTLSSSTGDVIINGTFKTDNFTSFTNNTDITLTGQGSGSVAVNNTLKVDRISERTTGSGTTFASGVKFANTASGYVATQLDYIEQFNATYSVVSVFTTNVTIPYIFFREGPVVHISQRASLSGVMSGNINITVTGTVPARLRPPNTVFMCVYCQVPTPSPSCVLEIRSNGFIGFSFVGSTFLSGSTVTIPPFTEKYSV